MKVYIVIQENIYNEKPHLWVYENRQDAENDCEENQYIIEREVIE